MRLLAVVASLLAVTLLPPAVGADTLLYTDRLTVHDANGRVVGSAWPASWQSGFMEVEFRYGSVPVIVRVWPDRFHQDFLRFTGRGCTGQLLKDAFEGELYRYTAVAGPRSTVYVQSGPVRARTTRSTLTADGVCNDHSAGQDLTVPMRATDVNLADHFVPPFTTRTRGRTAVPLTAP